MIYLIDQLNELFLNCTDQFKVSAWVSSSLAAGGPQIEGFSYDQRARALLLVLRPYRGHGVGSGRRRPASRRQRVGEAGGLWFRDKLVGKIASVFTSTGSQHGGQESTILSTHIVLMHLGMVIVGLPYTFKGQLRMDEITGGSPYGASTLAEDADGGDRQPSDNELDGARFQGRHVAELAMALVHGRRHLQAEKTE